ncbi:MAG: hypothetical protein WBY44_27395 [Bryobacteraceae bacterium]
MKKPENKSAAPVLVPGFAWPPPVLAELREIFRLPKLKPKLVEPPPKADA